MNTRCAVLIAAVALSLNGCGYNSFQTSDEQIKASWPEVVNQYQHRADLVPNLVNTVKGEAKFEQDTLTKVLVNNPEAFQKFQQAKGQLTGALSRLMAVSENDPNLNFSVGNEKEIAKPPSVVFDGTPTKAASAASAGTN